MQSYREDIKLLVKPVCQSLTHWVKLQSRVVYDYDTFATQHSIVAIRALFEQLANQPFSLKISAREREAMQALKKQLDGSSITFAALQTLLSDMLTNLRPDRGKWLLDIAWSRGLLIEAVVVLWPQIQHRLCLALQQRVLVPKLDALQQTCAIVTAQQTQRLITTKETVQAFSSLNDPSLTKFRAVEH
jgi:hypothetical protein